MWVEPHFHSEGWRETYPRRVDSEIDRQARILKLERMLKERGIDIAFGFSEWGEVYAAVDGEVILGNDDGTTESLDVSGIDTGGHIGKTRA